MVRWMMRWGMGGALGALSATGCNGKNALTVPQTNTETTLDTGTAADTATDIGPLADGAHVFDEDHVLVVPDGRGLQLLANDGSVVWFRWWEDLVGPCFMCGGEGASADGDGLLLAFTVSGPGGTGAVARLNASGTLDFRVNGFNFPHDAHRDPIDGSIIVSETMSQRIVWIAGDGSSSAPIRILDAQDDGWLGLTPNGNEIFSFNGRQYMLVSHRGGGQSAGAITLWDITDPQAPSFQWKFPQGGPLSVPHGCMFRRYGGRWWLIWAHTEGADEGGSVGLAVTDDPTQMPAYVADLLPSAATGPFLFLRGVELTEDGWLYLTDSGTFNFGGSSDGRVIRAAMPALSPTGASGNITDQVFVELQQESVLADGLNLPFEGWLWVPSFPL